MECDFKRNALNMLIATTMATSGCSQINTAPDKPLKPSQIVQADPYYSKRQDALVNCVNSEVSAHAPDGTYVTHGKIIDPKSGNETRTVEVHEPQCSGDHFLNIAFSRNRQHYVSGDVSIYHYFNYPREDMSPAVVGFKIKNIDAPNVIDPIPTRGRDEGSGILAAMGYEAEAVQLIIQSCNVEAYKKYPEPR